MLPAIRKLMGKLPHARPTARARLTHAISLAAGARQFVRGEYDRGRRRAVRRPRSAGTART